MKNIKTQKGITLIALVITIIVMLILVGVTISISLNGGLFGYAKNATKDTKTAMEQEKTLANGDIIDYYLNVSQEVQALPEYDKAEKTEGILTQNAKYVEGTEVAIIPKGFKISDEKEEQSIANGLVIQDKAGNEYVWVPVKNGTLKRTGWFDNEPTNKTLEEISKDFNDEDYMLYVAKYYGYTSAKEAAQKNGFTNDSGEGDADKWLADNYETWKEFFDNCFLGFCLTDEYTETLPQDLVNSVRIYKGFYIGRYTAGSEEIRTEAKKDTLTEVLTKKGQYVYNYVSYNNAIAKIGDMYKSKTVYGVEATLPYGAMYDETLRFVKDDTYNVSDSRMWGNYADTTFSVTGKYCTNANGTAPQYVEVNNTDKPEGKKWLLTTGASERNKAKNIYDLAGNVFEWTSESYEDKRVYRGGCFHNWGACLSASFRHGGSATGSDYGVGFRLALYIK